MERCSSFVWRGGGYRRWRLPVAWILVAVLAVPACAGGGEPATSIQVKGSDTMVNLGSAWAEDYMAKHPEMSIAVTGGGSGTGIAALINKTADICQASREMRDKEYEQARSAGFEPKEFVVAQDALSVVVHPSNPVSELTIAQLSAIYTNRVTNWKELGGADTPIVAISRDTNSGTHVYFKEHMVQMAGLPTVDRSLEYGPDVLMVPSTKTAVDEVTANPNAIAYVGMGYVTDEVKAVAVRKDQDSPAVFPSLANVQNGTYALARPLYLYARGEPSGAAKDYIDWILGPEGQAIVQELDFIPVE